MFCNNKTKHSNGQGQYFPRCKIYSAKHSLLGWDFSWVSIYDSIWQVLAFTKKQQKNPKKNKKQKKQKQKNKKQKQKKKNNKKNQTKTKQKKKQQKKKQNKKKQQQQQQKKKKKKKKKKDEKLGLRLLSFFLKLIHGYNNVEQSTEIALDQSMAWPFIKCFRSNDKL